MASEHEMKSLLALLERIATALEWQAKTSRGAPAAAPRPAVTSGGVCFPNYGRSKGMPIVGASMQDLEFYSSGARRSIADPEKSRWHDKERDLLAAIEAEITRQGGGGWVASGDATAPPPNDEDYPF